MYEFSLPSFIHLFNENLRLNQRKDGKSQDKSKTEVAPSPSAKKDTDEHINRVRESLKLAVLYYVSRSLFKADRLMFGLHMIHCLQPQLFQPKEWELFTGELVTTELDSAGDAKASASVGGGLPGWATKDRAAAYTALASNFAALISRLNLHDHTVWNNWAKSARCEQEFPSMAIGNGVSPFQRLLLVQALRPDRLQSAIQMYVCETLQVKSLAPPQGFNLAKLVEETSPTEPILFVATAGADPSQVLPVHVPRFDCCAVRSIRLFSCSVDALRNWKSLR
jgi:dynein heavy chain 2